MKLLTVNVHAWLEDDQEKKLETLADVIAEKRYDVIALQEVNQRLSSPKVIQNLADDNYGLILIDLLKARGITDYSYHWAPSHIGYDIYDEGLAILSRYPVLEVDDFYTSKSQDPSTIDARKILKVTLDYEGEPIEVYSCHMNLPTSQNETQADNLHRLVSHSDFSGLKLFMGDFNTDAIGDPDSYQHILDQGLYDTYHLAKVKDSGVTASKAIDGWQDHRQDKRLDYIFVNRKLTVESSRVIFNQENHPVISDHFGIEVVMTL